MNKQLDTLLTLRDNINVVAQTLFNQGDMTGETMPLMEAYSFQYIEMAEALTGELMWQVDPTTRPDYQEAE